MIKVDDKIISQIKESKQVAIYVHTFVDADCIGSSCALKIALEKLGKQVDILGEDLEVPKKYMFIPKADTINKPKLKKYDLGIAVDVASVSKLGMNMTKSFNAIEKTIRIDHHETPADFAKLNFVKSDFSSTAIIMYYLLPMLGIKDIDKDIATCLYSGISGDTGCFMHKNTQPIDHEVACKLMKKGADAGNINWWIFKYTTPNEIALKQKVLGRYRKYLNGKVGVVYIFQKDLQDTNTTMTATESILPLITAVEGCELCAMVCEKKKGLFKASLRSNNTDAAVKVAMSFGGGGHAQSAGCQIFGNSTVVVNKIVKAAELVLGD